MTLSQSIFNFAVLPQYRVARAGLVIGVVGLTGYGIYRLVKKK